MDSEIKYFIEQDKILYRKERDGGLIYFKENGELLYLNETASILFEALIKNEYSIQELCELLIKKIKEKPEKEIVMKDIKEFIENIKKLGILKEKSK